MNRIANGDSDLMQNILAWIYQNWTNACVIGKHLSIGEQINFRKHRTGEYRSGIWKDIGHARYHVSEDVYNKNLYYNDEVEILHFQVSDESVNCENINNEKGTITSFTSIRDSEVCPFSDWFWKIHIEFVRRRAGRISDEIGGLQHWWNLQSNHNGNQCYSTIIEISYWEVHCLVRHSSCIGMIIESSFVLFSLRIDAND